LIKIKEEKEKKEEANLCYLKEKLKHLIESE
jgi:hypothetical protein